MREEALRLREQLLGNVRTETVAAPVLARRHDESVYRYFSI